jgi:lipopolysaccharide transport system ATP-binding protein
MSIISVKNLGKKYDIFHQRGSYVSLRDVLMNAIKHPFGFLKRKANGIIGRDQKEAFWALSDVNFEVEKGEVIGIIGRNGAGKSTLLKILSQITPPTTGEIRIRGRVGSLLEVGTGFHPELSGRENIMLNGAILGMPKSEIIKKFDDIVEFAGVQKFLDTPVKYYSSGMYVRLAFSVAAHMEPDILIVDEVLAVGDAEFQKKCLGKMGEATHREGRTIIFVSHNMDAIRSLCTKCILLEDGKIKSIGKTDEVIKEYISVNSVVASAVISDRQHLRGNKTGVIKKVAIANDRDEYKNVFAINEPLRLTADYEVSDSEKDYSFWVIISDNEGRHIVSSFQKDFALIKAPVLGSHKLQADFANLGLLPGRYVISLGIFMHTGLGIEFADWVEYCLTFDISQSFYDGRSFDSRLGLVDKPATWSSQ